MINPNIKWNGNMGNGCNLPIDCVHCDISECGGRRSEDAAPKKKIKFCPKCQLEYRGSWAVKCCMECGSPLIEKEEEK